MTIRAVLFDLGNTLVYSRPEETFQRILKELGIVKTLEQVKQAITHGNREFDIEKHFALSAHEFYTQWNLVQLRHLGIKGSKASKLAGEIDTKWFNYAKLYLFPDVKKTVQKLKEKGLKLGIITGGYEEDVEQILPKVGIKPFFDVCVGVNTTGKRKPHPKAFEHALKQLCVKSSEAVFVGDNFEADYQGAENAGLIPILVRRKGPPNQRLYTDVCLQLPPDVRTITRFDEILEVLEEFSP